MTDYDSSQLTIRVHHHLPHTKTNILKQYMQRAYLFQQILLRTHLWTQHRHLTKRSKWYLQHQMDKDLKPAIFWKRFADAKPSSQTDFSDVGHYGIRVIQLSHKDLTLSNNLT